MGRIWQIEIELVARAGPVAGSSSNPLTAWVYENGGNRCEAQSFATAGISAMSKCLDMDGLQACPHS